MVWQGENVKKNTALWVSPGVAPVCPINVSLRWVHLRMWPMGPPWDGAGWLFFPGCTYELASIGVCLVCWDELGRWLCSLMCRCRGVSLQCHSLTM